MTEGFFLGVLGSNLYFFLKMGMIFCAAKIIQSKYSLQGLYVFIIAWIVIQVLQTAVLLGLSLFELMYSSYFLIIILTSAFFLFWKSRCLPFYFESFLKDSREKLIFLVIFLVIGILWLRSQFLPDLTWDAQTYGIPRLSIWLNAKSIFIHMPTQQLNLFVNEWNAELNSLAYALASGSYVGFSFGNLEIFILFLVAIVWAASLLGAPIFWAFCMAAALGSSPAILGIASTVKGDLLACTASILAFGGLLMLWRGVQPILSFMLLFLLIALAVGSKMSALLLGMTLFALSCFEIRKYRFELYQVPWYGWLCFIAALFCFLSRFWVNWIQYGNPIKRVEVENIQFNMLHFFDNFKLLVARLFNVAADFHGPKWALATGMSVSVWFVIICGFLMPVLFACYKKKTLKGLIEWNKFNQKIFLAGFLIFVGVIYTMMLSPAYIWSFRYFLPSLLILLLIFGCVFSSSYYRLNIHFIKMFAVAITLIFVGMNLISIRWGEIFPAGKLAELKSKIIAADTPLKRAFLSVDIPYSQSSVSALDLDGRSSKKILIFNELNASLLPFIGSYAQNKITTVVNGENLISSASRGNWDFVVIAQRSEFRDAALPAKLAEKGYTVLVNNALYVIAVPNKRVKLNLIKKFKDLNWELWDIKGIAKQVNNKSLKLETRGLNFVSQPLKKMGPVLIKAHFEGEIVGGIWNTANLSLYGKELFFILVKGNYKPVEPFYSVINISEGDNRLAFSLGDWEKGIASIRLVNLEVFQLQLSQ